MSFHPTQVRPKEDWVLVLADARKSATGGGIILPASETGVEKVTEGSGTALRVGIGKKASAIGLENGCRILYRSFLKEANPIPSDEKWENGDQKRYFLMSIDDVLAVLPPDLEVGVFSGRPQIPEG